MTQLPQWCLRNRETMPAQAEPHPFDIVSTLARHNPQWSWDTAPSHWARGAPLGNGDFGAIIYGSPENLTFVLGKTDLWMRATDKSHFPGASYAELLRIYREGDRDAFEALKPQDPHWMDSFAPSSLVGGGFLRLHLAEAAGVRELHQELSLYEATYTCRFRAPGLDTMWGGNSDFEITSFVSAPHEVLAIKIHRARLPLRSFTWRLNRESHRLLPDPQCGGADQLCWLTQELLKGDRYAIALWQGGVDVDLTPARRSVLGESNGEEHNEALLYLAAATQRDSADPLDLACSRVRAAADAGFEAVHRGHKRLWSAHWDRSWVSCSDRAIERPWYLSNYLCGAILRPGKVSPGLQGMWCRENQPPWDADFHGNVNIQAVYHGLFGSNRMELFEPYARLYREMLPQCRKDTKEYFGLDGARLPHGGSIEGYEICEHNWPTLAVSMAPSAWIARMYWWAYLHNLDRDFLARSAYPILRDVALYYHGLLDLAGEGADGRYLVEPSIWGEYRATELEGWGTNSSYEIAAHRAAFGQAISAARILGIDGEHVLRWREALEKLPPMPTDENGAWIRWPGDPHTVGANSFFYPVFPCELADAFSGPSEMLEQARATWTAARKNESRAGFGGASVGAAARLADAEWAYRAASQISHNGLVVEGNGTMQADHGPGMSFALNSMLALGVAGKIIPFAAMPKHLDVAFHSLRVPGAILMSGAQQGGRVRCVSVLALKGGQVCLLSPFEEGVIALRRLDQIVAEESVQFRGEIAWEAEAGVVYTLETV